MHSAVFVALEPTEPIPQSWFQFIELSKNNGKISQYAAVLARNVWVVNFQEYPAALGFLISSAEACNIDYTILPLADEPQWIRGGPSMDHNP